MVVKPGVSKANYIPALSGELKASIFNNRRPNDRRNLEC